MKAGFWKRTEEPPPLATVKVMRPLFHTFTPYPCLMKSSADQVLRCFSFTLIGECWDLLGFPQERVEHWSLRIVE